MGLRPRYSWLVLGSSPEVAQAEELFRGMGIKSVTGSRYLGGLIGDREAEDTYLAETFQG